MAILLPHCDTRSLSFVGRGVKAKTNISFFLLDILSIGKFKMQLFDMAFIREQCSIWVFSILWQIHGASGLGETRGLSCVSGPGGAWRRSRCLKFTYPRG